MNNRPRAHKEEKSWGAERWNSGPWGARQWGHAPSISFRKWVLACNSRARPKGATSTAPPGRMQCFQTKQINNQYIFWVPSFSRLCQHSHGGRRTWHKGPFLDPTVVLFMVGHYTHKVIFLIRIKFFSLKIGSLISVQESWRSWGQIHMNLRERRASVKERNKVRKRKKGNPSVLRRCLCIEACGSRLGPPAAQLLKSSRGVTLTPGLERDAHSGAPLPTYQTGPSVVEPMNLYFNNLVSWFWCAQI